MSSDIAIKVENLSKCYQIYDTPRDRLKQFVMPKLQRAVGMQPKQYYREFWALKDVSFEVKKGETVGIIGRNGSGKSTLLQMICGTLSPTTGSITTHGRIAALLELGSGFNPEFSGRENVYLYASVLGLSDDDIEARFDEIAAFADIGEFIEQPIKTYSSGMVVRLAFAVIAHVDADILVIDEALAVGDAFFTQKCMRFIRKFQSDGGTLLFVSHDTGAIINLCSTSILLQSGCVIKVGLPKEISEHYLSMIYENNQPIDGLCLEKGNAPAPKDAELEEYIDSRHSVINNSNLRNDIEIFQFNPQADAFGTGEATIQSVRLMSACGKALSWVIGGENVILEICCLAKKDVLSPIIGFTFKDRLGQVIFGDNTYLSYRLNPMTALLDSRFVARFEFRLPILPSGSYSIAVAVADGTQESHVQHQWIHDAILIKVHASSICFGLVGIPMKNITLENY
jgi:lipopolysaccharide transport system ATP-binding protein